MNMKKIIMSVLLLVLLLINCQCFAEEATRQRMFIFTNKHNEEIAEVDYYLERGGKILKLEVLQKNAGVVYCYIVLEHPINVPDYPTPHIKTKDE